MKLLIISIVQLVTLFAFCQVDEDGFSSEDYVWMGDKACSEQNWVDGISMYRKAIFLDSLNVSARVNISKAFHQLDQIDSAIEAIQKSLLIDSTNTVSYTHLTLPTNREV